MNLEAFFSYFGKSRQVKYEVNFEWPYNVLFPVSSQFQFTRILQYPHSMNMTNRQQAFFQCNVICIYLSLHFEWRSCVLKRLSVFFVTI